ncbi:hypothetical protein [Streptomyces hygroscopicus]|nr:hypothetical protein [Streptomyces hygroscopicus]
MPLLEEGEAEPGGEEPSAEALEVRGSAGERRIVGADNACSPGG